MKRFSGFRSCERGGLTFIPLTLLIAWCLACICGCEIQFPTHSQTRSECVILAFGADYCAGCNADKAAVDQLEADGAVIRRVDVATSDGLELARRCGVTSIPSYVILVGGNKWRQTDDIREVRRLFDHIRRGGV